MKMHGEYSYMLIVDIYFHDTYYFLIIINYVNMCFFLLGGFFFYELNISFNCSCNDAMKEQTAQTQRMTSDLPSFDKPRPITSYVFAVRNGRGVPI